MQLHQRNQKRASRTENRNDMGLKTAQETYRALGLRGRHVLAGPQRRIPGRQRRGIELVPLYAIGRDLHFAAVQRGYSLQKRPDN